MVYLRATMRALLILNPAAGRGRGQRWRHRIVRALRAQAWSPELVETREPGEALTLARKAAIEAWPCVIAAGGDGTVHEVANGLLQAPVLASNPRSVAFGVVPLGTGNDFARLVRMRARSPERNIARLVAAQSKLFDVGRVVDEYFVNSMGVGFGAEVVRQSNTLRRLSGFALYLAAAFKTIVRFHPPRLEVRADEFREMGEMTLVEVAVGTTAGGGFRLTPRADPTDGLLDVCLIRAVNLGQFLVKLPRVARGRHETLNEVELFQTRRVTVVAHTGQLTMHLDGEFRRPDRDEVSIHVEPKRLNVLVGA